MKLIPYDKAKEVTYISSKCNEYRLKVPTGAFSFSRLKQSPL